MKSFHYYNPTKLIFGKDAVGKLQEAMPIEVKKVLVHYGRNSIKKSGLYHQVIDILEYHKIPFVELGGVTPNPKLSLVREGIELCRKEEVDFVLAVGGGSAIDSAKAIAAGVKNHRDIWELFLDSEHLGEVLPIGVILTIPATGSESSDSTVITNEDTQIKTSLEDDRLRPVFALLNPQLTLTLPETQTFAGIVDILSHTMERYFPNQDNVDLTDQLCEGCMRTAIKNAYALVEDPNNYNARAEIMLSGTVSHSGILGMGRLEDWASHRMGHEITALYGTTHGVTLSVILPAWMKYVYQENVEQFAQFAQEVFYVNSQGKSKEEVAKEGIAKFESFLKDIHMPINFQEANIPMNEIELMAEKCTQTGPVGRVKKLYKNDVIEIYRLACK